MVSHIVPYLFVPSSCISRQVRCRHAPLHQFDEFIQKQGLAVYRELMSLPQCITCHQGCVSNDVDKTIEELIRTSVSLARQTVVTIRAIGVITYSIGEFILSGKRSDVV